mgnify:CR=1 FL=1
MVIRGSSKAFILSKKSFPGWVKKGSVIYPYTINTAEEAEPIKRAGRNCDLKLTPIGSPFDNATIIGALSPIFGDKNVPRKIASTVRIVGWMRRTSLRRGVLKSNSPSGMRTSNGATYKDETPIMAIKPRILKNFDLVDMFISLYKSDG